MSRKNKEKSSTILTELYYALVDKLARELGEGEEILKSIPTNPSYEYHFQKIEDRYLFRLANIRALLGHLATSRQQATTEKPVSPYQAKVFTAGREDLEEKIQTHLKDIGNRTLADIKVQRMEPDLFLVVVITTQGQPQASGE
ncbi:MAG: hypothetical protein HZA54_12735 [Planctomycetes bacterium]|nr:hypothetical protein [Planctomycetota bacterium]